MVYGRPPDVSKSIARVRNKNSLFYIVATVVSDNSSRHFPSPSHAHLKREAQVFQPASRDRLPEPTGYRTGRVQLVILNRAQAYPSVLVSIPIAGIEVRA